MICGACVEVIDFQNDNMGGQLTIYGQVNNSELHDQSIRVTRTSNSGGVPKIINSATVYLNDDEGNRYNYSYDSIHRFYIPTESFTGIPGRSYQLSFQIGDQQYQSSFQRMPIHTSEDSTYFEFRKITTLSQTGGEAESFFMQAYTDSKIPVSEEPLFIRWDILQVYVFLGIILPSANFPGYSPRDCYIQEPFIGASLRTYDGREVGSGELVGQFMAETLLDESFHTLRGFGIVQNSITEEAYDYWSKIEEVSNRQGSIFETPPAAIKGNIVNLTDEDDFVLGFFEVAQVDTTGTFVTPDDLPVFIGKGGDFTLCNEEFTFGQLFSVPFQCYSCLADIGVPPECLNCTILNNSSRTRPSYLF